MKKINSKRSMDNILVKINKAGVRLLRSLTAEETYKTIVQEAVKLVKADFGSVFLYQNGRLERVYTSNPDLYSLKIRKRGFTYRVFRRRIPAIIDVKKSSKIHPLIKQMDILEDMMVPVSYRNRSIGVLTVQCRRADCFTEKHLDTLKLFASIASLAIRKTQLHAETEKALETRDMFIAMASHELKTPLTTVNGYVQLLNNKPPKEPQQARWVKELSWETYRLTQLLDELLTINRIKTGKLQYTFKECSLVEILNRSINNFQFNYPRHKVVLENHLVTISDVIVGDFDKLMQVITNILNNAAKFSKKGSKTVMKLSFKNPLFTISIKDCGIGIKKEDLPKVFNLSYKSNNEKEGMGMGLFLAKNIIEQHHGFIDIKSVYKEGTEVIIKLPIINKG